MRAMASWTEIGDRVFVRRYAFYDQNIGVVLGGDDVLLIDTRSTHVQAREIVDDLRTLTRDAGDARRRHARPFRPCLRQPRLPAGDDLGPRALRRVHRADRRGAPGAGRRREAEIAADLAEVVLDPPDRTFAETAYVDVGDRRVELRHLGRGHTDHDIVIKVPDAAVMFAGDLIENGAFPSFGDGYPLDWPETASRLAELVVGVVVPGTATTPGGRSPRSRPSRSPPWPSWPDASIAANSRSTTRSPATPFPAYPAEDVRRPLQRALAQLRGELGVTGAAYSPIRTIQRPRAPPATIAIEGLLERIERDLGRVHPQVARAQIRREAVPQLAAAARSACSPSPSRAARRRAG